MLIVKYGELTGPKADLHEKGVDTYIATDMVVQAAKNEYDVAILIASDGDYVPVVNAVRELGKKVELGFFRGSISMALRAVCDVSRRLRRVHFSYMWESNGKSG